jgi:FKBP-type peptidyl-prolyl cis-trans isomerase FkpA
MKTIKIVISLVFLALFSNCSKDSDFPDFPVQPPLRDVATQYKEDIALIEKYLKTHAVVVVDNPGGLDDQNATLKSVPNLDPASIWGSDNAIPKASLLTKTVKVGGIDHKIYYEMFRNGTGVSSLSNSDQLRTCYSGFLMNETSSPFDSTGDKPADFPIKNLILGWQLTLPLFKMGSIVSDDLPNPYRDFGSGMFFLPSALAYYESSPSEKVPAYTPIAFSVRLYKVF